MTRNINPGTSVRASDVKFLTPNFGINQFFKSGIYLKAGKLTLFVFSVLRECPLKKKKKNPYFFPFFEIVLHPVQEFVTAQVSSPWLLLIHQLLSVSVFLVHPSNTAKPKLRNCQLAGSPGNIFGSLLGNSLFCFVQNKFSRVLWILTMCWNVRFSLRHKDQVLMKFWSTGSRWSLL